MMIVRKPMLMALLLMPMAAIAAPEPHPAKLVGQYDGGQIEMAAGLELGKDGKFRYGLSYGALDEAAAGSWEASGETVILTVQQYESNDPSGDGKFGPSILQNEDGVLTIPRYDRLLKFRKR